MFAAETFTLLVLARTIALMPYFAYVKSPTPYKFYFAFGVLKLFRCPLVLKFAFAIDVLGHF